MEIDKVEHARPQRIKNFKDLLNEVKQDVRQARTLNEIIKIVSTYNGRFQQQQQFYRMLSKDEEVIQHVIGNKLFTSMLADAPESGAFVAVSITEYGRLRLLWGNDYQSGAMFTDDIGFIPVSLEEQADLLAGIKTNENCLRATVQSIDACLGQLKPIQIVEWVEQVIHMTDHVDPILIYIENQTYTCFGKFNNLFAERSGEAPFVFQELIVKPYGKWQPTEKVFIYSMCLLAKAGFRGEEFNGLQLTPDILKPFFAYYFNEFSQALQNDVTDLKFEKLSLMEQANTLALLRAKVAKKFQFVRDVNGLNFNKRQLLLPKICVQEDLASEQIVELYEHVFHLDGKGYSSLTQLFEDTFPLLDSSPLGLAASIEQLIVTLVSAATSAIRADIGMSRGIRSWHRFIELLNERNSKEIIDWPTTEYFCCVVPSDKMRERIDREQLVKIVNAIAQRMDYNSWHYIPGHFNSNDRHYYFPPRMPDTAEWSNLHHAGHILANVLFSIRSPKEIEINGQPYFGVIDLRFMRQSGNPFTVEELQLAVTYTEYMQSLHQALVKYILQHNKEVQIQAFNKEWFRQNI